MTDAACHACAGSWPRKDRFIVDLRLSKVYWLPIRSRSGFSTLPQS
jgi:hypothetical protein